jgi:hypothetical protein
MHQYLLSICYPAGATPPPPAALEVVANNVRAVSQEMKAAGVWVFAAGLQPPDSASVVRAKGGEVLTTDGPFIESKEQIGGICIITAATLDEALNWGAKMSGATTTAVEVRPMQSHG